MKIFAGQIYGQAGISFPFSIKFQGWLGAHLSRLVDASEAFESRFPGFTLGLRVSARTDISEPEVKGPSIYKRDKSVEYSIFLPHESRDYTTAQECSEVLRKLLGGICRVLSKLQLDSENLQRAEEELIAEFLITPGMLD